MIRFGLGQSTIFGVQAASWEVVVSHGDGDFQNGKTQIAEGRRMSTEIGREKNKCYTICMCKFGTFAVFPPLSCPVISPLSD